MKCEQRLQRRPEAILLDYAESALDRCPPGPPGPVVLNWWVVTQKWVADPFSVGRGPLPGEGNAKKNPQTSVIHTP